MLRSQSKQFLIKKYSDLCEPCVLCGEEKFPKEGSTLGHVDRREMMDPLDGTTDVKRADNSA